MAYIPTNWQTGDVITAAKLNKAEEGIEAADNVKVISCQQAQGNWTLDLTAADIISMMTSGTCVYIIGTTDDDGEIYIDFAGFVSAVGFSESGVSASIISMNGPGTNVQSVDFKAADLTSPLVHDTHA